MKKSVGLGDYFGTLGGTVAHIAQEPPKKLTKGMVVHPIRNIQTNPAKKGSYGMYGFTLSERQGAPGVCGEYQYHSDPYCTKLTKEMVDARPKLDAPFRPAHITNMGLRGPGWNDRNIGEPIPYVIEGPANPKTKQSVAEAAPKYAPFKPSHPPKSGQYSTLEKYPDYHADPIAPKLEKAKMESTLERSKRMAAGWKPSHTGKIPGPTRSVVQFNMTTRGEA